jgi:hypothetical protein
MAYGSSAVQNFFSTWIVAVIFVHTKFPIRQSLAMLNYLPELSRFSVKTFIINFVSAVDMKLHSFKVFCSKEEKGEKVGEGGRVEK